MPHKQTELHNSQTFLLQFFQHLELWQNGGQLLGKFVAILAALETEKQIVK